MCKERIIRTPAVTLPSAITSSPGRSLGGAGASVADISRDFAIACCAGDLASLLLKYRNALASDA